METNGRDAFAELEAMKSIASALENLADEPRLRVIKWVVDHFNLQLTTSFPSTTRSPSLSATTSSIEAEADFGSAAELVALAAPKNEADKALLVAYWFQEVMGASELEAQTINTELKHLGHGLSNVTQTLNRLMSQKPQPVIQLRKGGTTKQARKKYKLTAEGARRVRAMLAGNPADENESGGNV